jgi:hypothetical protein
MARGQPRILFYMSKDISFNIGIILCLFSYLALLINHPDPDSISVYPEPVDYLFYEANFPNHRGAEAWTMLVHKENPKTYCPGKNSAYFRNVGLKRCKNLLTRLGLKPTLAESGSEQCRYFYATENAAKIGVEIIYIASGKHCWDMPLKFSYLNNP